MKKILNKVLKPFKILLTILSPKISTKFTYFLVFRKKLNLKNPKSINEKIQYLKLNTYYNNTLVTNCIDKYKVREYLKNKGLESLCPKLYGVYDKASEINWDNLPNSFVVKCNHSCGTNIIVKDKQSFDTQAAVKQLNKWMKENYYRINAEVQYKFIERKIIIEEYLGDVETYKFYCFNGKPKTMYISTSTYENGILYKDKCIDFFDMDFRHLDYVLDGHPNSTDKIKKPVSFNKMKDISKTLSNDFPFVRVDLYDVEGTVYISELTFIPTGGFMKFQNSAVLDEWGSWLDISKGIKNKRK